MGKFGKKNEVSLNPLDYNVCILGEGGLGKTTLAKEVCEKLTGENGYIHFDIGNEFGASAIQNIVTERIENWAKLTEVVDDIVENKNEDYPELKVVIWDTLDELVILAETETIRQHNKKNPDKKTDTINSAMGGFGKGQEYAISLIINEMSKLRSVGVSSIIIGHLKRTDIIDPITQETYSKLTADTTQKYFNAIKNKQHFVCVGYIDREIVKEKTGRKNIATKQDITINKAVSESRVLTFRDDTYSVDSKSRFADIVDRIPFDSDAFIKAMKDAILAEQAKGDKTLAQAKKDQKIRDKEAATKAAKFSEESKLNKVDQEKNEELKSVIQAGFSKLSAEQKTEFKKLMAANNVESFKDVSEIPTRTLEELANYLGDASE